MLPSHLHHPQPQPSLPALTPSCQLPGSQSMSTMAHEQDMAEEDIIQKDVIKGNSCPVCHGEQ